MINTKEYRFEVSAAGRVNLIGEHVDYCGGQVLPCALSLKCTVYARPNGTDYINLAWTDLPDQISLDIRNLNGYRALKHAKYQAGCAYLWQTSGHEVKGCDLLIDCKVPFGSGLSSSAAIEVSTLAAYALVAGERPDPVEIAKIAQRAEQEYAGVNCGIMDQYDCLADVRPFELLEYRGGLPLTIYRRAKHVVDECYRVQSATAVMQKGDMKRFGELLTESHRSLAELYEVTGKELDSLAHAAWDHYACAGARMTGAGFGGCTVNLVKTDAVEDFKQKVCRRYKQETGYDATCYDVEIGDGLKYLEL